MFAAASQFRPIKGLLSVADFDRCRGGRLRWVSLLELIEVRPGVRGDKPCFVGTRITVYDVLEYLAGGMTAAEITEDFPELTERHVRAAPA